MTPSFAPGIAPETILDEVLCGLLGPWKTLPSKLLYDELGSRLFEQICELPEYYVTRAEIALLEEEASDIAARVMRRSALIEFGSGASEKTRRLLDATARFEIYAPIDISETALAASSVGLCRDYPGVQVAPVAADFTQPLTLPRAIGDDRPRFGFFPGSTIGNFEPDETVRFLKRTRGLLGPDAQLLVGVDLVKPLDVLLPAYNDAQGVTAAFNKNLLTRLNREADADFDLDKFVHCAIWNAASQRIEMHLVSTISHQVRVAGHPIDFHAGETIHTESSHKYRPAGFAKLAKAGGWQVAAFWVSPPPAFGLFLLRAC